MDNQVTISDLHPNSVCFCEQTAVMKSWLEPVQQLIIALWSLIFFSAYESKKYIYLKQHDHIIHARERGILTHVNKRALYDLGHLKEL